MAHGHRTACLCGAVWLVAAACAPDASDTGATLVTNADCNRIQAVQDRCSVSVMGIEETNCDHLLYFAGQDCLAALHSYVNCASDANCRPLRNGQVCFAAEQDMLVACQNGNATITVGTNSNNQTTPRTGQQQAARDPNAAAGNGNAAAR